jgi:hypothetical protein
MRDYVSQLRAHPVHQLIVGDLADSVTDAGPQLSHGAKSTVHDIPAALPEMPSHNPTSMNDPVARLGSASGAPIFIKDVHHRRADYHATQ